MIKLKKLLNIKDLKYIFSILTPVSSYNVKPGLPNTDIYHQVFVRTIRISRSIHFSRKLRSSPTERETTQWFGPCHAYVSFASIAH